MNYESQTGVTIKQAFYDFHEANPHVYRAFKGLALKAIHAGRKSLSAKQICGVIRWEYSLKTVDERQVMIDGEKRDFKINDAFTAHYARLFIREHPQYAGVFETRRLRSNKNSADLFDAAGL